MSKQRLTAYLILLAVAIIWGIAIAVIKVTLQDFSPLLFLTYRFFLTSLILFPILAFSSKEKLPATNRDWWMLALVGLLGSSVNLGLLFWGLTYTTSLSAAFLTATSPIMVVIAGAIFLKEKIAGREKMGLLIAFLGTLLLTLSPEMADGHTGNLTGNILILIANLSWVAYVILTKIELAKKFSPLFLTTTSFFFGFLSLIPAAIMREGSLAGLITTISEQPFTAHLGVWYMAALSGALAYWLYQEGQKRIEASEAALFSYLPPLFTAPLALFWLGEQITLPFLIGALVIATGVAIAEYRKK
ncbi:DMT family transporter [Candidatus Microgenomates bacterium]|nr:DMT family transporter [Candidatus Microgenomates bacterium]